MNAGGVAKGEKNTKTVMKPALFYPHGSSIKKNVYFCANQHNIKSNFYENNKECMDGYPVMDGSLLVHLIRTGDGNRND